MVMTTPSWGSETLGPGRSGPEKVCPYFALSDALEHAPACGMDATNARQAAAVAKVPLPVASPDSLHQISAASPPAESVKSRSTQ
jgi:hypothetical protein